MEKIIILILSLFLTACATDKPYVEVTPVKADSKIMQDCGDYILPENNTKDFIRAISKNQDTFNHCKTQNQGKKEFIELTAK